MKALLMGICIIMPAALALLSCQQVAALSASALRTPPPSSYLNPVLDQDFPDPTILKARDGFYYAYATGTPAAEGGPKNIAVSRSKDLIHWEKPTEALPMRPKWADKKKNFWAPHVIEHRERFYLFYSAEPNWSKSEHMRLSIATSDSPLGPFTDRGEPLDTNEAEENIDSMPLIDPVSGRAYLYWGRNGIISVRELAADLTSFAPGSEATELLFPNNSKDYEKITEAPFVIYHQGYYYLFYSGDDCCVSPHYAVLVARSKSPLGPFEKLSDQPGRSNGVVLAKNPRWLAPGHNSVFADDQGQLWLAYHAVDSEKPRDPLTGHIRRVLLIDRLHFDGGWPFVRDRSPSLEPQPAPALSPSVFDP